MSIETRTVELKRYRCERCGYEWDQHRINTADPKRCAKLACKSPYWNTPRTRPYYGKVAGEYYKKHPIGKGTE